VPGADGEGPPEGFCCPWLVPIVPASTKSETAIPVDTFANTHTS
jgi:hypothetical protein